MLYFLCLGFLKFSSKSYSPFSYEKNPTALSALGISHLIKSVWKVKVPIAILPLNMFGIREVLKVIVFSVFCSCQKHCTYAAFVFKVLQMRY